MRPEPGGYLEYAPDPLLAPWVERIWSRAGPRGVARVLPDGCADVILVLSSSPRAFVVGPMTTAFVTPPGSERFVGIRFRPGAARPILGLPLAEVLDRHVELDLLWADAAEVLGRAVEAEGAVAAATAALGRRVARASEPDRRVRHAVERAAAGSTVESIAHEVGLSRQHLATLFRREVGHGPRLLGRVLRMRRAVGLLNGGRTLADAALLAGYCDQPHMTADLGELAGLTPARLR